MTFKEWRSWYREKNWTSKWFVILILIRPIVDNFYWMKDISPLLSPLNIVGVLTPVFIFLSVSSGKMRIPKKSGLDSIVRFFGFLVIINCFALDAFNLDRIVVIGDSIKNVTFILLFFYLKRFIQSHRDLLGILQTFLYACIFPFAVMFYENIFHPITAEYLTEGRGGGSRIRGGYADVMTYAVYIVGFFLTLSYFFLRNVYYKIEKTGNLRNMLIAFAVCLIGLISIKHVSTWAVFFGMIILLFSFNIRNARGIILLLIIFIGFIPFFGKQIYDAQITPLIQKEIDVAEGTNEIEGAFNGRVGRWQKYYDIWKDLPVYSMMFGVPLCGTPYARIMVGGGMHSDYMRLGFLTGLIGLISYFVLLALIYTKSKRFNQPERYLILCASLCIVLHSVSTLPTQYASYMYLFVAIFTYSFLPKNKIYVNEQGVSNSNNRLVFSTSKARSKTLSR